MEGRHLYYVTHEFHVNWMCFCGSEHECSHFLGGVSVLKAQVLAGGRGLGRFDSGLQGGVKIVNS